MYVNVITTVEFTICVRVVFIHSEIAVARGLRSKTISQTTQSKQIEQAKTRKVHADRH